MTAPPPAARQRTGFSGDQVRHGGTLPHRGTMARRSLCIILPTFNEEGGIHSCLEVILQQCQALADRVDIRLLVVDDGSTDATVARMQDLVKESATLELLCLRRNFGKEAAILAGLSHTQADAAIVMDSDLQHPPLLIPQMIDLWLGGAALVEACRISRGPERPTARGAAWLFHRLFARFSGMDLAEQTDYKLLDRQVIDAYLILPERKRFFRGLIAWMHFPSAKVYFQTPARGHGKTSWSRLGLLRYSLDSLTAFSSLPLHSIWIIGLLTFCISLLASGMAVVQKFFGKGLEGFTTVIILVMLATGAILFSVGLLGVYIGRIFEEVKGRPIYLIDSQRSHLDKRP